jgi:hypothetical protein
LRILEFIALSVIFISIYKKSPLWSSFMQEVLGEDAVDFEVQNSEARTSLRYLLRCAYRRSHLRKLSSSLF